MARLAAVVASVIGTLVPLTLTACGDGSDDGAGARSATSSSSAGTRLGGEKSGIVLTLPERWRQVDPTRDTSPVVRTSFGLDLDTGELVEQLLAKQVQQGIVFAVDGSVTSGFAPHLTAGCDRGGLVGASLEQLKRKQQALEPGSRIIDVAVGGRPGFKATYESTKKSGPVSGMTVRTSISADRFCFVDIEARKGALPSAAETIASSFTLA